MIRTKMTMFAFGVLALSGVSAMAATKTTHRATKTSHQQMTAAVTAPAEGAPATGDAAKPADEGKEAGKKAKKAKGHKAKDKAAGGEAAPAPTPEAK